MTKVKVLQGCAILERGLWFHQGAVLEVEDPDSHFMTITPPKGAAYKAPCVELTDEPINIPEGLFPTIKDAPEEKE